MVLCIMHTRVFLEESLMVNTWVSPGHRAGYCEKECEWNKKNIATFHFPKDESLRNIWVS